MKPAQEKRMSAEDESDPGNRSKSRPPKRGNEAESPEPLKRQKSENGNEASSKDDQLSSFEGLVTISQSSMSSPSEAPVGVESLAISNAPPLQSSLPLTCSVHYIKFDLYCQACNELVCGECFFDDDTHRKCTIGDGANTKPAVAKVSKCVEAVVNWQAMNPVEVSGLSVDRVHEDHSAIQQLIDELRDARLQLCRVEGKLAEAVSQYQSCGGAAEEQAAALQRLAIAYHQVKHVKARCDDLIDCLVSKLTDIEH